ncbi:hypothetical protein EMIT0P258_20401 [Pseudomonas sp. IT-P258]
MQKRANSALRAFSLVLCAFSLAGVLIELRSGVEPSVPSGSVVSSDGTVRVASEIAVNASRSPEGS